MLRKIQDIHRLRRWSQTREIIRQAGSGPDRLRLLRSFGDDIRALMPELAQLPNVTREEMVRAMDVVNAVGAVLGAWLQMDPGNSSWPGRDRLFLTCREDLILACAMYSTVGAFPLEAIGVFLDEAGELDGDADIPGVECAGARLEDIPNLVWESAVESGRSKRRWNEQMGANAEWAVPEWRDSPAAWHTCCVIDSFSAVAAECRGLTARGGEAGTGLVMVVKVPRQDEVDEAALWKSEGWDVAVVNRNDCISLYQVVTAMDASRPQCVLLPLGPGTGSGNTRVMVRRRDLLGEMSDSKFNEIMGELLGV